jgi:hypothetical protein
MQFLGLRSKLSWPGPPGGWGNTLPPTGHPSLSLARIFSRHYFTDSTSRHATFTPRALQPDDGEVALHGIKCDGKIITIAFSRNSLNMHISHLCSFDDSSIVYAEKVLKVSKAVRCHRKLVHILLLIFVIFVSLSERGEAAS